jgi:hypothetical protein
MTFDEWIDIYPDDEIDGTHIALAEEEVRGLTETRHE